MTHVIPPDCLSYRSCIAGVFYIFQHADKVLIKYMPSALFYNRHIDPISCSYASFDDAENAVDKMKKAVIDLFNNRKPVILHHAIIDGKRIAYSNMTEFLVQVGQGKGSYKTKYTIAGNFEQAFLLYRGINIGTGYKKRLIAPQLNKPLLARMLLGV